MKYQLVVFDMDGTILDTLGDLTDSINAVLSENGLPGRTEREVRSYLGNGLRRLVELSLPDATPAEMTDRVFLRMKDYYASHCAIRTCPYDGILPLIRRLKENGIKVAVVSNKPTLSTPYWTRLGLTADRRFTLEIPRWIYRLPKTRVWTVSPLTGASVTVHTSARWELNIWCPTRPTSPGSYLANNRVGG